MKANLQAEKTSIIRQFKMINDPELIETIKNILNYGMKKQEENSVYNIPESHKQLVRNRIRETKQSEFIDFDIAMKKLEAK